MCISDITCVLSIHMYLLLKTRISHGMGIIINKYYIAHVVLQIIPTQSSLRNVLPVSMCSESDLFTSLAIVFFVNVSFLKLHTGDSNQ